MDVWSFALIVTAYAPEGTFAGSATLMFMVKLEPAARGHGMDVT